MASGRDVTRRLEDIHAATERIRRRVDSLELKADQVAEQPAGQDAAELARVFDRAKAILKEAQEAEKSGKSHPLANKHQLTILQREVDEAEDLLQSSADLGGGSQARTELATLRRRTTLALKSAMGENVASIVIVGASGLKAVDFNGKSDPFCVFWVKGEPGDYKTETHRKTLDPTWNHSQTLSADTAGKTICFEVKDWNRFSSTVFLGKAALEVSVEPCDAGEEHEIDLPLEGDLQAKSSKDRKATGTLFVVLHGLRPRDPKHRKGKAGNKFRERRGAMCKTSHFFQDSELKLEVKQTWAEVAQHLETLSPYAVVARDLQMKWSRQKSELLALKKQALTNHLASRDREEKAQIERDIAKEALKASCDENFWRGHVIRSFGASSRQILDGAVSGWRSSVHGAQEVRRDLVKNAIDAHLEKVADWVVGQESAIVKRWTDGLASSVRKIHSMDAEILKDVEEARDARRTMLEETMMRQQRALLTRCRDLQAEILREADSLTEQVSVKRVNKKATMEGIQKRASVAVVGLVEATENRMDSVMDEAQAAKQAHRQRAQNMVDDALIEEAKHAIAFKTVVDRLRPELQLELEEEVIALTKADKVQTRGATWECDACGASTSVEFQFCRKCSKLRGGPAQDGSGIARPSRPPRAGRVGTRGSPGSPGSPWPPSREASPKARERKRALRDFAAIAAGDSAPDAQAKALQDTLVTGQWAEGNWRLHITQAAEGGLLALQGIEAAMGAQAAVLRSTQAPAEPLGLGKAPKDHLERLSSAPSRLKDSTVGVTRARLSRLTEAMREVDSFARHAESELIPAVSALAQETESMVEVGRALQRSPGNCQEVPAAVVAGAWRRSLGASFTVLQELWETAQVPEPERRACAERILAVIARAKSGRRALNEL